MPALMQLVQAFTRLGVPFTSARTRWMFGSQRRLFRLCENVTAFPKNGFLPQMSHTAAIGFRGYQTTPPHSVGLRRKEEWAKLLRISAVWMPARGGTMAYDYVASRVDAYAFVRHPPEGSRPSDVVGAVAGAPGFRFAGRFAGAFSVFVAVEAKTLADLQGLIDGPYWDAGVRTQWSVVVSPSRVAIPKRGSPDHCAIVRATVVEDPISVVSRLDDRFEPLVSDDLHYGSAVVSGSGFDVLIDVGTPTFATLVQLLVEQVHGVPGIGSTDTAFAFLPGNGLRP